MRPDASLPAAGDTAASIARLTVVLGALTAFAPFATDMYLSGFGRIAGDLGTDIARVQLSLSTYFFGMGLGQLCYGPLIDAYGRRRPLLIGVALFLLSSLAVAAAGSAGFFIAVRLAQAIGGCAGMIVSRAIIHDLLAPREAARALSQMMIVQSVGPIAAPVLGGYILTWWGWRAIFVFQAVLAALCLSAAWRIVPETLPRERRVSVRPAAIGRVFAQLLRNPDFMVPALAGSLAVAVIFPFISGSSFVFMSLHGVSQQRYGYLFGVNAFGMVLSSQLSRVLLKRVGPRTVLFVGLWVLFAAAAALLCAANAASLLWLMLPLFVCIASLPLTGATGVALAMAAGAEAAGSASSIIGVLQFSIGSLLSALLGLLHNGTAYPMCGLIFACALLALLTAVLGRARLRR